MSRVVLCLAAMAVAVAAFPANTFFRYNTYSTNAACTSTSGTALSTSYYPVDLCIRSQSGTTTSSTKYTIATDNANVIVAWRFTDGACTTGVSNTNNYTTSCGSSGSSKATFLTSTVGMYESLTYSDSSCGTLYSGPSFGMSGCEDGTQITVGGKIEFCFGGSSTDCSGDSTCLSTGRNACDQVQGNSSPATWINYDWNAASSATPAVALTAALIALVAAVTKF